MELLGGRGLLPSAAINLSGTWQQGKGLGSGRMGPHPCRGGRHNRSPRTVSPALPYRCPCTPPVRIDGCTIPLIPAKARTFLLC